MKLSDYEFFPGVVTDVADPKYLGRVKASVPTIFDQSMDKEGLPWIHPFTMVGYQGFSKMREGSKIWVLNNTKNKKEFWYVPMFELNQDTRDLINTDENYENGDVLIARNNGNNSVYIYYNDTDGIMIKYGNQNLINIDPNSQITIQASDGKIVIKDNHVYIGDGEKGHPAVKGDKLKDILHNFFTQLSTAATTANTPYSLPLFSEQLRMLSDFADKRLDEIICKNTSVD